MIRIARALLSMAVFGAMIAGAQAQDAGSVKAGAASTGPTAQTRQAMRWEFGPFVNGGSGVGDRSDFQFFSVGFQGGKPLSRVMRAGILSGQFELGANIMPIWQAYTPAPHNQEYNCGGTPCDYPIGGGTYTGLSLTPVILRWNFANSSRHFQPWFQGAGGLVYTTHKFPPTILVPHGTPGGTCVWNFSPQGGIGFHYFLSPKRSIDIGINAVHISSASLGDKNPGVNASMWMQVGYTYWK